MLKRLINDKEIKVIFKKSTSVFIINIIGTIFAFGSNILMTRSLGAKESGYYFLSFTVMTVLSVISKLGIGNYILIAIASNSSKPEKFNVQEFFNKSISIVFIFNCLASTILYFNSDFIAIKLFNSSHFSDVLRWSSIAVFLTSVSDVQSKTLQALKRIKTSSLVQNTIRSVIMFTLLILFKNINQAYSVVVLYIIGSLTSCIVGNIYVRKSIRLQSIEELNVSTSASIKSIVKESLPLYWVDLCNLLMNWSSIIILGIFSNAEDIASYSIANKLSLLVSFFLVAVNSSIVPSFPEYYNSGNIEKLESVARKSTLLMLVIAGPIFLIFMLFSGQIMSLFGEEFSSDGLILTILSLGSLINLGCGSVGYLLVMSDNVKIFRDLTLLAGILNVLFNFALVPLFADYGAALANAASIVFLNVSSAIYVRKKLGFFATPFLPKRKTYGNIV